MACSYKEIMRSQQNRKNDSLLWKNNLVTRSMQIWRCGTVTKSDLWKEVPFRAIPVPVLRPKQVGYSCRKKNHRNRLAWILTVCNRALTNAHFTSNLLCGGAKWGCGVDIFINSHHISHETVPCLTPKNITLKFWATMKERSFKP